MDYFITLPEAAARLGISRQRLHQIVVAHRLGRRIGHMWALTPGELARLQQSRRPAKRNPTRREPPA